MMGLTGVCKGVSMGYAEAVALLGVEPAEFGAERGNIRTGCGLPKLQPVPPTAAAEAAAAARNSSAAALLDEEELLLGGALNVVSTGLLSPPGDTSLSLKGFTMEDLWWRGGTKRCWWRASLPGVRRFAGVSKLPGVPRR